MGTLKIISLRIHFRGPKACAKISSRLYCKQAAYYSYIWNAIYVLTELTLVSARASSWMDGVCGCGLPPEPRGPQRLSYTTAEQPLFGAAGPRGPGSSCPALPTGPAGWLHHSSPEGRFIIIVTSIAPDSSLPSSVSFISTPSLWCVQILYAGHRPQKEDVYSRSEEWFHERIVRSVRTDLFGGSSSK